jgi:pseudouridine-5'-monophosphatase
MQVVAVPDHRTCKSKVKNASIVLKSLNHFRPEEFGLPPFDEE